MEQWSDIRNDLWDAPGLHHKKVQPFGNIAQFSFSPSPSPPKPHTTGNAVTLVQSRVGPGVAGNVRFKKRQAKKATTFCKTFVHDCIILLDRGPKDTLPRQVLCTVSYMKHRLQTPSVQVTSIHSRSKIPTQAMEQAIPALYSGGNIFCQPDRNLFRLYIIFAVVLLRAHRPCGLTNNTLVACQRFGSLKQTMSAIYLISRTDLWRVRVHEFLTSGIC